MATPEPLDALKDAIREVISKLIPSPEVDPDEVQEEVRGFAVEMGNGMDYWFTFLTVSGVGLMDDRAERAVREFVV